MDAAKDRLGIGSQLQAQAEQHQQQERQRHRQADPRRYKLRQPVTGHGDSAPMRRQLTLDIAPRTANGRGCAFAQRIELGATTVHDPVAAFETEADAQVQQLQQVQPFTRALQAMFHELEHLLAAPRFVVHSDQQALLAPVAAATPGVLSTASSSAVHNA